MQNFHITQGLKEILNKHNLAYAKIDVRDHSTINLHTFPQNQFTYKNEEMIEAFNEIFFYLRDTGMKLIRLANANGISTRKFGYGAFNVFHTNARTVMYVVVGDVGFRMSIGAIKSDDEITGTKAFQKFKRVCESVGFDLSTIATKRGKEISDKETGEIEKYKKEVLTDRVGRYAFHSNSNHIDINSAFMANASTGEFAALRPAVQKIYDAKANIKLMYPNTYKDLSTPEGKEYDLYKGVLTHCYGYMRSQFCIIDGHGYALANVAKQAVNETNKQLEAMRNKLILLGWIPTMFNTDGIWFDTPPSVKKKDILEALKDDIGDELGQWKLDVYGARMRIKSAGSYEYTEFDYENGKTYYHPVQSGLTTLDKIKPRSEWKWGDIFDYATAIVHEFDWERGIYEKETE